MSPASILEMFLLHLILRRLWLVVTVDGQASGAQVTGLAQCCMNYGPVPPAPARSKYNIEPSSGPGWLRTQSKVRDRNQSNCQRLKMTSCRHLSGKCVVLAKRCVVVYGCGPALNQHWLSGESGRQSQVG